MTMELVEMIEFRPILGDGAMGTMLLEKGLEMGDCPEAWNLEKPDVIAEIHKAYVRAGSDFVETNTFGANPIKLARYDLDSKLQKIIMAGVDAARKVAGDSVMVAGSIGPTGAVLEPYGDMPGERVRDAFMRTVQALDSAGVDFFLIETMSDPNEARLAVAAAKEVSTKPIVATMAFSKGAKGYRTMMGTSPADAATALLEAGAQYVGTNCCSGFDEALEIMTDMVAASPAAIVVQPNAGLPSYKAGKVTYPETPEAMAGGAVKLLETGMRIVGGCCGTTPAHIKEIGSLIGKC
jgi:5-methyltetrahydrofolate--homocysteine methyltransferase